jgi:hypothetical protein
LGTQWVNSLTFLDDTRRALRSAGSAVLQYYLTEADGGPLAYGVTFWLSRPHGMSYRCVLVVKNLPVVREDTMVLANLRGEARHSRLGRAIQKALEAAVVRGILPAKQVLIKHGLTRSILANWIGLESEVRKVPGTNYLVAEVDGVDYSQLGIRFTPHCEDESFSCMHNARALQFDGKLFKITDGPIATGQAASLGAAYHRASVFSLADMNEPGVLGALAAQRQAASLRRE